MKSCPSCNRTYPDDTFAFCLNDGALLSAPFDPQRPGGYPRPKTDPPPTEMMPQHLPRNAVDLPPTLPAMPQTTNRQHRPQVTNTTKAENVEGISGKMIATIVILLLVSIVLAVSLSRC